MSTHLTRSARSRPLRSLGILTVLAMVPALFAVLGQESAQAAVRYPAAITSVKFTPGPAAGQVTGTWKTSGANTTSFKLVTALTTFTDSKKGRSQKTFTFSAKTRKHVFTVAEMRSAGATLESGNFLFGKFYAYNSTKAGTQKRMAPGWQSIAPLGKKSTGTGQSLKIAQYNIRLKTYSSTGADTAKGNDRWSVRQPKVVKNIVTHNPDVLTLQETTWNKNSGSQVSLLRSALNKAAASKGRNYKYNRSTPYRLGAGKAGGTQANRILYDANKYFQPGTDCDDTLGQSSCTFLPINDDRWASYIHLAPINAPTQDFWVVSAHLDTGRTAASEKTRTSQVNAINKVMSAKAGGRPLFLGMDSNTWQTYPPGATLSRTAITKDGFYDTSASANNAKRLATTYHWSTDTSRTYGKAKPEKYVYGWAPRLDVIGVKYLSGADDFYVDIHTSDPYPGSDHNLVWARVKLKK